LNRIRKQAIKSVTRNTIIEKNKSNKWDTNKTISKINSKYKLINELHKKSIYTSASMLNKSFDNQSKNSIDLTDGKNQQLDYIDKNEND